MCMSHFHKGTPCVDFYSHLVSVGVYGICVLCFVYNCVLRREILRFIHKNEGFSHFKA